MLEVVGEGAVQPNLSDQQRQFQTGRAFGLMEFISHVESVREQARQAAEARPEIARQKLDRELRRGLRLARHSNVLAQAGRAKNLGQRATRNSALPEADGSPSDDQIL